MEKEVKRIKSGKRIREIIFGANDALVSNLALVAGLSGAVLTSNVIIIAGIAEAVAGAISMGVGGYISSKSQVEFYNNEIKREKERISKNPEVHKKELRQIYKKRGFKGKELENIVNKISSNKKTWLNVMLEEELGLAKQTFDNPKAVGVTIGLAFLLASFIPILPFFFISKALIYSIISTIIILFLIGMAKTTITGKNWFKSGIEMVIIGIVATALSYFIGNLLGGNY